MPSKMTKEERAEYQREYRARKKAKVVDMSSVPGRIDASLGIVKADLRIAELEDEVRRLKRELAGRAPVRSGAGPAIPATVGESGPEIARLSARFGAPRPAPKPGAKKR